DPTIEGAKYATYKVAFKELQ
nr:hexamerin beta subunit=larval storage protein {N-terminal} [Diaprepes abbreviatus, Peptide Partial, 20 aa] [Diaprepes abbreviatus]